jgi:hypothetical protein
MKKLLFVFIALLFLSCKKDNPTESPQTFEPVDITVSLNNPSPTTMGYRVYAPLINTSPILFISFVIHTSFGAAEDIWITNPKTSTDTLKGRVVFVDSSTTNDFHCLSYDTLLTYGDYYFSQLSDNNKMRNAYKPTFNLAPGDSIAYCIWYYHVMLDNWFRHGSFTIYHNVPTKLNPIIIRIDGSHG